MSDLSASLQSAKSALDKLDAYLKSDVVVLGFPTDPQKSWIDWWTEKLKKRVLLDHVLEDLERRSDAFLALKKFPLKDAEDSISVSPPIRIQYGRVALRPETARHVFVTAYVSLTWSVYDLLYDLFSRLCGSSKTTCNDVPSQNKKLSDLFECDKGQIYCGHDALLRDKYYWIYRVSYVVRNAFVHEGGRFLGIPLLQEDIANRYFQLSDNALSAIETWIDESLAWQRRCLIGDSSLKRKEKSITNTLMTRGKNLFPWYNRDIRTLLLQYNSHLDDMFAHMMVWSVNSFIAQVEAMLGVSIGFECAKVS